MLFAVHFTSLSMFRFLASFFQTMVATMTGGSFALLFLMLFSGFVIQKREINLPVSPVHLEKNQLNKQI